LANPLTTLPLQTILNFMEEKDTITQNEETNINADGETHLTPQIQATKA